MAPPLVEGPGTRPTMRMCLLMADVEETEHGPSGRLREWLARATRAPRDPIWIADGVVSERWLPVIAQRPARRLRMETAAGRDSASAGR